MNTQHLYINHPGCKIGIHQNQLTVKKTNGEVLSYPLQQIQRITVATLAHFSGAAIKTLFQENIPTLFCSQSGFFRGRLSASQTGHGQVNRRAAQYRIMTSEDPSLALGVAKIIIHAKIANQQRIITQGHHSVSGSFTELAQQALQAPDMDSLRGYEGQAARLYFAQLGQRLKSTEFRFSQRLRPARDPVNALLSFGYALLQTEFEMALDWHGLDRFAGFMHCSDGSQPALILDLMEPFRPLADRLALTFLQQHFKLEDFSLNKDSCRLKEIPRSEYLKAWEYMMQKHKKWLGETSHYRRLIERQVLQWVHVLEGDPESFKAWTLHG